MDALFQGLRPASTALIASAGLSVAGAVLFLFTQGGGQGELANTIAVRWPSVILCGVVFVCMRYTPLKKLHPVAFIAAAAVAGVVFQL